MEVVRVTPKYYTVIFDSSEHDNITQLAEAWEVEEVNVITWVLVRALNDAIAGLNKISKRRKGGKYGD